MFASHLYVHVPFCARRCSYCDFSIAVRSTTPVDEYVAALARELETLGVSAFSPALTSVYLGGGTPSRLGGAGVSRILAEIRRYTTTAPNAELTLEANPNDVTPSVATEWAVAGINRVSLGSQTFDDGILRWMHRTHDAAEITMAVRNLRAAGIFNISLDLIFALPSHLRRRWDRDLERALALFPSHISLYGLTIESYTPLAKWKDRGGVVEASEDSYADEFLYAHETLTSAGFRHYEVSNFATPGKESRHNSAYWSGAAYVGIGPAAHSFTGSVRRWNVPAYSEWLNRLLSGKTVIRDHEILTADNVDAEEVYLGLRTDRGLALRDTDRAIVEPWEAAGWGAIKGDRLVLTASGWLRLDALAATLTARRTESTRTTLSTEPSHCYI